MFRVTKIVLISIACNSKAIEFLTFLAREKRLQINQRKQDFEQWLCRDFIHHPTESKRRLI